MNNRDIVVFTRNRLGTAPRQAALAIAALFAAGAAWGQAASITELGDFGGGQSWANSVSADGSVVVGGSSNATDIRAFRWAGGNMNDMGTLGGGSAEANGVSGDGSVVVGVSQITVGYARAFRWTEAGGMADLGTLGGNTSWANGVSSDGTVVVGRADFTGNNAHAFRWVQGSTGGVATNPQMYDLGTLGGTISEARGVSADGAVVVGNSRVTAGSTSVHAFRWTATGGMVDLRTLTGDSASSAEAVSADGRVVAGRSYGGAAGHAFRWVQGATTGDPGNPQMHDLGNLGGNWSQGSGISADGSVVVGVSGLPGGMLFRAFRWTQATGMQSVEDWLRANGVSVPTDITHAANATNRDGNVVVGSLDNGHAFIARVSTAGSGLIDTIDLGNSLEAAAMGANMALRSANTLLNGAHSRPLMRRTGAGRSTAWVAGDWGRDDHGSRNGDVGLAEVGLGHNYGDFQLNVSLGQTWAKQNLIFDGRAKTDGTYLLAEALVPVTGELWATLGAYGQWGKANLRRGYLNATLPDASSASPKVDTWGLRARLDWDNLLSLGDGAVSPYADLSYSEAKMAAYTETGGGFPASFEARKDISTELHLGAHGTWPMADTAKLVATLEAAHRFERHEADTRGQVVGLLGFSLPGAAIKQDWLRAGVGLEGKLGEGTGSLMLNATSKGDMPGYWLAANWQMTF